VTAPDPTPSSLSFAAYATFVVDIRAGIFGRKARLYETTARTPAGSNRLEKNRRPAFTSAAPFVKGLTMMHPDASGLRLIPGYLDQRAQVALLAEIAEVIARAPLYTPRMPRTDRPLSVRMTNCGTLGWVADIGGYRYQPSHPKTGQPWPPIPAIALRAWQDLAGYPHPPEACLINVYDQSARMGLHQDRDEEDFTAPVVSLSLGSSCTFRVGGVSRKQPTRSLRLASGDALVLGGTARLAYHGVDGIIPATSTLLRDGERINLTLRRVKAPHRLTSSASLQ
jgi:DNA oxidative demethylase